jgi:hypothetical protein
MIIKKTHFIILFSVMTMSSFINAEDTDKPNNIFTNNLNSTLFPRNILWNNNSTESVNTTPRKKTRADYPQNWQIAKFNRDRYTNKDIEQFIEDSKMSDAKKIQLFKEANKDYQKYLNLKAEWIYTWIQPATKQFLYYRMLKEMAIKEGRSRKAFTVTKHEYWDILEKTEYNMLKKLLEDGRGIQYARSKFGEFLKKQNYPHRNEMSNLDIYFVWKKTQDNRIKEQLRIREVKKFEFYTAHPKASPNYFMNFGEMHEIKSAAKEKVDKLFSRDNLNQNLIEKTIEESPEMMIILKNIKSLSLSNYSMKVLYNENSSKYRSSKELIDKMLPEVLNNSIIQKILKYEEVANKIYKRSMDRDKLLDIASVEEKKVTESPAGNYQALAKAKIYRLAASMISSNHKKKRYLKEIISKIKDISESILQNSSKDDFYLNGNEASYLLPELIYQKINKYLITENMNSYQKRLSYLASWFIKFEIKKLISKDIPIFIPELRDEKTMDFNKKLELFWLNKTYNNNLKRYKERTLKYKFKYYVEINPTGKYNHKVMDAMNYILVD